MSSNFDFDPNELIMNIMSQARKKSRDKLNTDVDQRIAKGEFTREEYNRDYVVVEWSEMQGMNYVHNCILVKKTEVGSVVITDMLGKKFTLHHNGPLTDEQILVVS